MGDQLFRLCQLFLCGACFLTRGGTGLFVLLAGLGLRLAATLGLVAAKDEVDVILHAAGIFLRRAAIDQHQPVGGQFDHMPIVADQDHRPAIGVERLHQGLARVDIKVVGRLVEDEDMRRIARHQRQREARPLAARQRADIRRGMVAREAEAPQLPANSRGRLAVHGAGHQFQRAGIDGQFLHLILGEIADLHLAGGVDFAVHRGQLRGQQARQRGLAVAVSAQQRDAVIGGDPQVEARQDRRALGISHAGEVQRDQRRAQFGGVREVEAERRVFHHRRDGLHLGQHLGAALRLFRGGGAGRIARHEILQFGGLRFLRSPRGGLLGHAFGALFFKGIISAGVQRQLAALQMQDVIDNIVQQIALVADDDQRAGIGLQEILQPQRRLQIEVVRWLVEQHDIGRGEQQAGQRHPHFPPARKAVQRLRLHLLVKTQPDQDAGRAAGGRVGVNRQQAVVNIAQAVRFVAGFAFGQQFGAFNIGGQHGVKRGGGAVGGLLRDIAEAGAARHFDLAVVGFQLADDGLYQRRFARTIAADQAHLAAGGDGGTGAIDDIAPAKADGDVLNCQHAWPLALMARLGKGTRALALRARDRCWPREPDHMLGALAFAVGV